VQSDFGFQHWASVTDGPPLAESQAELTPLQRDFILYAKKHHEPDEDDMPDA
jgi:hypothetical protein